MEAELSPEERHLFDELTGVITEELYARIAVEDRFETVEDARAIAVLIADALWDGFEIRERPSR